VTVETKWYVSPSASMPACNAAPAPGDAVAVVVDAGGGDAGVTGAVLDDADADAVTSGGKVPAAESPDPPQPARSAPPSSSPSTGPAPTRERRPLVVPVTVGP
jgi:hypothetical protein